MSATPPDPIADCDGSLDEVPCAPHGFLLCEPCAYDRGYRAGLARAERLARDEAKVWRSTNAEKRADACEGLADALAALSPPSSSPPAPEGGRRDE
jgi:hypothetical protein